MKDGLINFYKSTSNMFKKKEKKPKTPEVDTDKLIQETIANAKGISGQKTEQQVNRHAGEKRTQFNYVVKNAYGQTVKSMFDAYDIEEVRMFLTNEGYEIVSITPAKAYEKDLFQAKISTSELSFVLTQLSTYIKAGIPLIDSVRILAKQTTVPSKRKVYERIVYDLVTGNNFSQALENQSATFPRLLINMVKTSEMTGDLPSTLDEMADYYTSIEQTRKDMLSALMYPSIILVVAIAVIIFVLVAVVPSFTTMYEGTGSELPEITIFTMNASSFIQNNWYYIVLVLAIIVGAYWYAFKNIKSFRKTMQTIYMHMPVFGNIIIYNEVTTFTKTFASLLNHSVNITDSMEILSKITNNEIYKDIIANTLLTLSKGGKISESFRGKWAFPIVAYEMLVTGESTGQLGTMMEKVSVHFGNLHKNAINMLKTLIEPITIAFLAVCVGFILLSIIIPMFDVYSTVQ